MNKQALRAQIREKKRAMTEEEIVSRSMALTEKFLSTNAYRQAKTIYGYLSYNQEVRTGPLLAQVLKDGKAVAVPKAAAAGTAEKIAEVKAALEDCRTKNNSSE